ncbi:MAG: YihY/virulence factor BrkB family protein, partial [Actinomycetota bacterium]|nr:YihY/virulence factor BrkB family protein [Actinomycetota bacterium]
MTDQPVPPQTGGPGQPRSPLQLPPTDWKETLRRTAKEFKNDRATLISAGMAFYWVLAVFPALVAAVGVFGLVNAGPEATESISKAIRTTLPGDAAEVLSEAVDRAPSGGASLVTAVVGLALALWSASAGMVALQSGMDVAYDIPQERERKFAKKRATALLLLVVAAVLGGIATVLVVFGQPLGEALRDDLPLGGAFVVVWTVLRWALAIGALVVLFASFYYLGPNRETPRWSWLSPGGVLGAVIWLLSSLGFSLYVSSFGSYAKTYGSFAGVVVLLLWLYLSALAVVVGGELNSELERQSAMRSGQV